MVARKAILRVRPDSSFSTQYPVVPVLVAPQGQSGAAESWGRRFVRRLDRPFDRVFGAGESPLRHLGALGVFFFVLLSVSGAYLYAVLDTSATGAYRSIDRLTRDGSSLGGLLRGIHRYAADAMVLCTFLHLAREWLLGRFRAFRWFSWLTGVLLLLFMFSSGIGGFWLNWDQLGQFSALATAEWLDRWPIFASPLTRNFLTADAVSDRLFSLFVFVHIGVALALLLGLWFHVQRISRADVLPPQRLMLGTGVSLLLLAVLAPVVSQAPAESSVLPASLPVDWFVLFPHPLMYATTPTVLWLVVVLSIGALLALPLLSRRQRLPVAVVDPAHCNGCRRCFDDCPYAAVTMVAHIGGVQGREMAQVDTDLCASCGICVGACPSSTPFRGSEKLVTGIDLPQAPIDQLRARLRHELAGTEPHTAVVIFGCDQGARIDSLADAHTIPFSLACIGMLPPSFVEYALRDGAAAVVVTGCRARGCEFRLGAQWTEERLAGNREPHLRRGVAAVQVETVWAERGEEGRVRAAIAALRRRVSLGIEEQKAEHLQ